jgi:mono/diheme cytochrome c family protein
MDMQDQPRLEAYEKGSIRQPVAGTVPRGYLRDDKQLYTGKKDQGAKAGAAQNQSAQQGGNGANMAASALYPDVVDTFPFPVTEEIVRRGEGRYNIFCAMCHGPTGYGDGMIVRRGYSRPPSYHTDQLRQAPVGHFFDVMTNGWGAMPSYAAQIPVADRWAIVAYIRALQLSQNPQGTSTSSNNGAAATPPAQPPAPSQTPARPAPRSETGGRR